MSLNLAAMKLTGFQTNELNDFNGLSRIGQIGESDRSYKALFSSIKRLEDRLLIHEERKLLLFLIELSLSLSEWKTLEWTLLRVDAMAGVYPDFRTESAIIAAKFYLLWSKGNFQQASRYLNTVLLDYLESEAMSKGGSYQIDAQSFNLVRTYCRLKLFAAKSCCEPTKDFEDFLIFSSTERSAEVVKFSIHPGFEISFPSEKSLLIFEEMGLVMDLRRHRVIDLRQKPQLLRALQAITKMGRMVEVTKSYFFEMVWGLKSFIPDLHDTAVRAMLKRMRKELGLEITSRKGKLLLSERCFFI